MDLITLSVIACQLVLAATIAITVAVYVPPLWRARIARRIGPTIAWFELTPEAGKVIDSQTAARAQNAISALKKPSTAKPHPAGGVIHRYLDEDGKFRCWIGFWGSGNHTDAARSIATASGTDFEGRDDQPNIPGGLTYRRVQCTNFSALSARPGDNYGNFAQSAADAFHNNGGGHIIVSFERVTASESKRKRAWVTAEQAANTGRASITTMVGPSTERQCGPMTVKGRVVVGGVDTSNAASNASSLLASLWEFGQVGDDAALGDGRRGAYLAITAGPVAALAAWGAARGNPTAPIVVGVIYAALAIASKAGLLNVTRREILAGLRQGFIPQPAYHWLSATWLYSAFRASGSPFADADRTDNLAPGKGRGNFAANPHSYDQFSFMAEHIAQFCAFPTTSHIAVGAAATGQRNAPPAATRLIGTVIGTDPTGQIVRIPYDSQASGFVAIGEPGSGKSTVIQTAMAHEMWERAGRRDRGEFVGAQFLIDTKGDATNRILGHCDRLGVARPGVFDLWATTGPRLDLIPPGPPERKAERVVDMMRYGWDDAAFGERLINVARASLTLAFACTPEIAEQLGWASGKPDPVRLAYWLVGGEPDRGMGARARHLFAEAAGAPDLDAGGSGLANAVGQLEQLPVRDTEVGRAWAQFCRFLPPYMPARDQNTLFETTRARFETLLRAPQLWDPNQDRPSYTLDQIILSGWAVVINTYGADPINTSRDLGAKLGAFVLYATNEAIRRNCQGWQAQDKHVFVAFEELRDVVGVGNETMEDVITEMLDQGRSFGVRVFMATQRPSQLPFRSQAALLSAGSKAWFRQDDVDTATLASKQLSEEFTPEEVRKLPQLVAACSLRADQAPQPPFTLTAILDPLLTPATMDASQLPEAPAA